MMPSHHLSSAVLLLAAGTVAASCEAGVSAGSLRLTELAEIDSPAAAGAGQPYVAASASGSALLSWMEPAESGHALRFARREGQTWSEPVTIAAGTGFFVNWADFPSITELPDGRLAAHWLARSGEGRYAYDVRLSWSTDGGATWSEPITPHTDGTQTEHGFVSLFPVGDLLGVAWLDGRNFAGAHPGGHGGGAEMTLRYASLAADGAIVDEQLIDGRTCECCQTDAALTARGPVVVYRNRTEAEVRDIAISRYADGGWTEPSMIHDDGWVYPGCPVNGPAVAARGDDVVVAWFTAAHDTPLVRIAFSSDGGATFSPPIRADEGAPAGRVDVLLLENGSALVTWLEREGEGAAVRVRSVASTGDAEPSVTIAAASAERASGFPRMAAVDGSVLFAWTEPGTPSRVRVATAPLTSVGR